MVFFFSGLCFGSMPKNSLANSWSWIFSLMLSSKCFIFLWFSSMIWFWVNFWIRYETQVEILFFSCLQLFQQPLLKRLPFPHWIAFVQNYLIILAQSYFCILCSASFIYVSSRPPIPFSVDYCSYVCQVACSFSFNSSFQNCFTISFVFLYKF